MHKLSVKNLVFISVIAAVYVVPVFLFSDISFGPIQCRISEILTVLTLFYGAAIPGLTIGCFLYNLVGLFLGKTVIFDLFFGTLATLVAAIISYYIVRRFKNKFLICFFGPLITVISNGIIVGYEITEFFEGGVNLFLNMATVALGESLVCYGLGVPLIALLFKNDLYKKIF